MYIVIANMKVLILYLHFKRTMQLLITMIYQLIINYSKKLTLLTKIIIYMYLLGESLLIL